MKKSMIPFICILLGSLITIIAGFYDYKDKLADKQEQLDVEVKRNKQYQSLLEKTNDLLSKSKSIISTQVTVIDTSVKIIDLQKELNEKNEHIQELQNVTLNNVTGGKSVPKLLIIVTGRTINIRVANDSEYPLRNVSVNITRVIDDLFTVNSDGSTTSNNSDTEKNFDKAIGDIPLNSKFPVLEEELPKEYKKTWYRFEVKWLTGSYVGSFNVIDDSLHVEITYDVISYYSAGLDLTKAVRINDNIYAKVSPYTPRKEIPEKVWVR